MDTSSKTLAICAVIKPRALDAQFIEVCAKHADLADQMIGLLRKTLPQASAMDNPPKTISAIEHVEPADQAVFGALLSALYEFTYGNKANTKGQSACAYAIYRLRQDTAFIVRASEQDDGFVTNYRGVPCESLQEAKNALEQSQEIRMLRDFQELSGFLKGFPKGQ